MAIETNNYVEYDTDGHFYYLTLAGVVYYTGLEELSDLFTAERLLRQGRMLHTEQVKSRYNYKKLRYRNIDIVEYRIFKDENGERQAVIDSLVNFGLASHHNDLDIRIMAGESRFNEYVLAPISNAGIYFKGEMFYEIPEDEYRSGY